MVSCKVLGLPPSSGDLTRKAGIHGSLGGGESPGSVQGLPDRRNRSTDMRIRGHRKESPTSELGNRGEGLTVGWREVSPSLDPQSFSPHVV